MGKKKTLSSVHASEVSLLPFLLTGRPMRLLNEVVLTLGRRDGDVLTRTQLGQPSKRRAIAAEPICDDPLG